MSNKGMVINECKRLNATRHVLEGCVDSASFPQYPWRFADQWWRQAIRLCCWICFVAVWREMICPQSCFPVIRTADGCTAEG